MIYVPIIIFQFLFTEAQPQVLQCQCLSAQKGQSLVVNAQPIDKQNIGDTCFVNFNFDCEPNSAYRYIDGRCNNAVHQSWGMVNTTIVRLLPAIYSQNPQDPPDSVRVSFVDNITPLQSPQIISNIFCYDQPSSSPQYTLAFMVLSQVMAHDVLNMKKRSPPPQACCKITERVPKELWDHGCLSIDIPEDDPFYHKFNVVCSQFTRAQTSDEFGCPLPEFEQANMVTTFVDASSVYGSSLETQQKLRLFQGGKLLFNTTSDGRIILPHQDELDNLCFVNPTKEPCYFTGSDFRINQHPHLALMEVIFLRVHNKFCDEFAAINANNPLWQNDEKIYQEAKRLVNAILQNILYGRYAEILFGPDCAAAYGLTPSGTPEQPYETGYDPELNPGTLAEFQNVASRAFHSLIQGELYLYDEQRTQTGSFKLSDFFFNPTFIMQPGIIDELLIGLSTQPMEGFDRFYSRTVTEELFKQSNKNIFGSNLAAIDILRGRDCGMMPYVYLATLANFPLATSFDDLLSRMDPMMVQKLQEVYATVYDIDSIIGCILEKRFGESMVGKTMHAILAEQFRRFKFADTYFYTFDGPGKFTPEQLNAIKTTSLSFLLCYGSDNLQYIQRDAFCIPTLDELVPCQTIIDEFLQQLRLYWVESHC